MIRLDDLKLFVRSSELGSFSKTAREVNLLPGQVSAAMQRLERELGKRLFARSTRSLRLTNEGEKYLPYAIEMLAIMNAGAEVLKDGDELQGDIKISVPSDLGRNIFLTVISDFCRKNPKLTLKLSVSDQLNNIFRDPDDVVIRYGLLEDNSYVALPLAVNNRRVLAASPDYIKKNGNPESVADLINHECLMYELNGQVHNKWNFEENSVLKQHVIKGRFCTDDADIARRWAIEGIGIVYKSEIDLADDIIKGRLEILLPGVVGDCVPLNLICPHRKQISPTVIQLHSLLKNQIDKISKKIDLIRKGIF